MADDEAPAEEAPAPDAAPEDAPPEDAPPEDEPSAVASPVDALSADVPPGDALSADAPAADALSGDASPEDASPDDASPGDASPGVASPGKATKEEPRKAGLGRPDTLNSEFLYYSSVLKLLAATLTSEEDKKLIIPWARKLFRPEYHSGQFREKRNKYLLYLTISLLNDEAFGCFREEPPTGALVDINDLTRPSLPATEWEMDVTWEDTVANLSEDFQRLVCSVHDCPEECTLDHQLDKILDQEFKFLLYILRPYAALLPNTFDRTRVATWMQTLCSIYGVDVCSSLRGIRNDYMMALLGYVQNMRVCGPFGDYPPIRTLPPLAEIAKLAAETKPITDPSGPDAKDFLAQQPIPVEGAFCYIALSGDLVTSNITSPAGPASPPQR